MIKLRINLIILFSVLFSGCAQRISVEEFDRKCQETYRPQNTLTGCVYYCGSKNGYDYVCFSPGIGMDDMAKIEMGLLHIVEMQYSSNRGDWVVIYPYPVEIHYRPDNLLIPPFDIKLFPDVVPEKRVPFR